MEDPDNPSPETQERWRKDPDNWIWGLFYYNKEDRRLLPPKRNPIMGFTINFANPNSVLFFVIMMLFFLMIVFLIASKR
jgi:uncharacterized membrane protein